VLLFFSVARSQEIGSWERATEVAQTTAVKPAVKVVPKNGTNPNFGMNMPMMSSAFDTAAWLNAA
jgi:IMP dehydrogenase/GMP reductase